MYIDVSQYEEQVAMSRLRDLERFEAVERLQTTVDRLITEVRKSRDTELLLNARHSCITQSRSVYLMNQSAERMS